MIFELQFYFNFLVSFFFSVSYSIYKDYKNYKDFPKKKFQGFTHNEILKTFKKVIPLVSVNLFISSLPSSIIFYNLAYCYLFPTLKRLNSKCIGEFKLCLYIQFQTEHRNLCQI